MDRPMLKEMPNQKTPPGEKPNLLAWARGLFQKDSELHDQIESSVVKQLLEETEYQWQQRLQQGNLPQEAADALSTCLSEVQELQKENLSTEEIQQRCEALAIAWESSTDHPAATQRLRACARHLRTTALISRHDGTPAGPDEGALLVRSSINATQNAGRKVGQAANNLAAEVSQATTQAARKASGSTSEHLKNLKKAGESARKQLHAPHKHQTSSTADSKVITAISARRQSKPPTGQDWIRKINHFLQGIGNEAGINKARLETAPIAQPIELSDTQEEIAATVTRSTDPAIGPEPRPVLIQNAELLEGVSSQEKHYQTIDTSDRTHLPQFTTMEGEPDSSNTHEEAPELTSLGTTSYRAEALEDPELPNHEENSDLIKALDEARQRRALHDEPPPAPVNPEQRMFNPKPTIGIFGEPTQEDHLNWQTACEIAGERSLGRSPTQLEQALFNALHELIGAGRPIKHVNANGEEYSGMLLDATVHAEAEILLEELSSRELIFGRLLQARRRARLRASRNQQ